MPDEVKVIDELDEAIDAVMRNPDATPDRVSPDVAVLLRVAADLRQLPGAEFRARLKAQLLSTAPLPRLIENTSMMETLPLALAELDAAPPLQAHDAYRAVRDMPELSMRFLAKMNDCTVVVSRSSAVVRWERHPAADELLYLMEGDAEVTTLTANGPVVSALPVGSVFVCPRALWHRIDPRGPVSLLSVTPGQGTEHNEHPQFVPLPASTERQLTHPLEPQSLRAILPEIPEVDLDRPHTRAQAEASFRWITELNECSVFASRFRGLSPWERHGKADELLHVLEGDVELTVLTDDGRVERALPRGSVFVCPRGLWHRQRAPRGVTILSGTARPTDVSWADDPRS